MHEWPEMGGAELAGEGGGALPHAAAATARSKQQQPEQGGTMKVTGEGEAVCFKEAEVRVMGAMEVLSCFNGGGDDHDQGGLKEVDFHSTESAEKKVSLLNATTKRESDVADDR